MVNSLLLPASISIGNDSLQENSVALNCSPLIISGALPTLLTLTVC